MRAPPSSTFPITEHADDENLSEYLVRVKWLKAVPFDEGVWEPRIFSLRHLTVSQLTKVATIDYLKRELPIDEPIGNGSTADTELLTTA